jgi:hypothetical protein
MIISAVIATVIACGIYWCDRSLITSLAYGFGFFVVFMFNLARAEAEELKLILDKEAPGWRERNASWTSTWDWNRALKKKSRIEMRG